MSYLIPDVPLITQTETMACWYASAQMLIAWRRRRTRMSEIAHPDPSEIPELYRKFSDNNGMGVSMNIQLAKDLGLRALPFMTPTPDALADVLRIYGPIWCAGMFGRDRKSGHVVVITGVVTGFVAYNDPWPGNGKKIVPYNEFVKSLQPFKSNSAGNLAPTMLYFPDPLYFPVYYPDPAGAGLMAR